MMVKRDTDGLTPRQKECLLFIIDYTTKRGYSPSFREIMRAMHLKATSPVQFHVAALRNLGWITEDEPDRAVVRRLKVLKYPTNYTPKKQELIPTESTEGLTERQIRCLNKIIELIEKFGYPPTSRELMLALNYRSVSAIQSFVFALEAKEWISFVRNQPRSFKVLKKPC